MSAENQNDIAALTVQLLSAFVSNNVVASEGLADLIKTTRAALTDDLSPRSDNAALEHVPAVSVRKSLSSPDHIISLIDGKPYKTLKRHLATHGLTDKQYRERYKLPASYPMVAPGYSEARRAVAEKSGLGRKRPTSPAAEAEASSASAAPALGASSKPAQKSPRPKGSVKASAEKPSASAAASAPAASAPEVEKPASASRPARKKLSIFNTKEQKSDPAATAASEGSQAAAAPKASAEPTKIGKTKSAAPKAKPATKPKTLKAALKAAGDHLSNDSAGSATPSNKS
jgi:predicted transcriptional regulator